MIVLFEYKAFSKHSLIPNGQIQELNGVVVFPYDYFNPYDNATGVLKQTDNTYSIHWYGKSWMSKKSIIRNRVTRIIHRALGTDLRKR